MIQHAMIKISGRVQGVFFRASAKERADELGVTGFVRNEANSTSGVYIEAEAEEEVLNTFIAWCKRGPNLARVDYCDIKYGNVKGFEKFVVIK